MNSAQTLTANSIEYVNNSKNFATFTYNTSDNETILFNGNATPVLSSS